MAGAQGGFLGGLLEGVGTALFDAKQQKLHQQEETNKTLASVMLRALDADPTRETATAVLPKVAELMHEPVMTLFGLKLGKGGKGGKGGPDLGALFGGLAQAYPTREEAAKQAVARKSAEAEGTEAGRLKAIATDQQQELGRLRTEFQDPEIQKDFKGGFREFLEERGFFKAVQPKPPTAEKDITPDPNSPTGWSRKYLGPNGDVVRTEPAPSPKAAGGGTKPGTEGFHLQAWAKKLGKNVEDLDPEEIDKARKDYRSSGWAGSATEEAKVNRAKTIADAIVKGDQPPDMTRMYGLSPYVREQLAKDGFNLTNMQLDWVATQKYVQTLNSQQQVNLRQRIDALPGLLDSIEDLAKQWDGGRFPLLNKANLIAARNGAYGNDVAAVAQQLEAQIAETTTDLAVVYRGGNAATNDALKLAQTTLQSDWSKDVLLKALERARKNVTIRRSSLTGGPLGVSGQNQYFQDRGGAPTNEQAPSEVPTRKMPPNTKGAAGIVPGLTKDANGNWVER